MRTKLSSRGAGKSLAKVVCLSFVSLSLLVGCEKAAIKDENSLTGKEKNTFEVPASEIGEFVAGHFEVTAYISANWFIEF